MTGLSQLPADERAEILARRLARAERALVAAEQALEKRVHDLARANRDLTMREEAMAERLRIRDALLLSAVATAEMATFYGERDTGYTWSREIGALLGLAPGTAATVPTVVGVVHPLDRARMLREGAAFFHQPAGTDRVYEHRIRRADTGAVRWLRWAVRLDRDPAGTRPTAVRGSVRDITQERANARQVKALQLRAERRAHLLDRMQRQVAFERDRSEAALAMRTGFLTDMAHALRTPLGALAGGLELLRDRPGPDAELTIALEAAAELQTLADRLLEEVHGEGTARPPAAPAPAPAPIPFDDAPRVLVADDTPSNRVILERILTRLGCEVVAVADGAQALAAARDTGFDCIFMDVMMPVMDGEAATRAIRALPRPRSQVAIVGVTAHSLKEERERLLSAGMTACLPKPVSREQLAAAVANALAERRPSLSVFDENRFRDVFAALSARYRARFLEAARADLVANAHALLAAYEEGDPARLRSALHGLRGVASNIGANGVLAAGEDLVERRSEPQTFVAATQDALSLFDTLSGDLD